MNNEMGNTIREFPLLLFLTTYEPQNGHLISVPFRCDDDRQCGA
jgi:hypothetical protein